MSLTNAQVVADGQLASSAAAIFSLATNAPANGSWLPGRFDVTLCNTSGTNTETCTLTFQRAGGIARRVARVVLAPNEQTTIPAIPIGSGDTLLGVASDATTVDYTVSSSGAQSIAPQSRDSSGRIQQTNGTSLTGNVATSGSVLSSGATGGVGYSTGAGGAVSQASSRTTGVTLNTVTGAITLVSAAGSATPFTFTVTNSAVAATDTVVASQKSGTDAYSVVVSAIAAGSFKLTITDLTGTTTETPVINFAVIKAVAS